MLWTSAKVQKGQVAQTLTRNRWRKIGSLPRIFPNPPGENLAGSMENRGAPWPSRLPQAEKRKQTLHGRLCRTQAWHSVVLALDARMITRPGLHRMVLVQACVMIVSTYFPFQRCPCLVRNYNVAFALTF